MSLIMIAMESEFSHVLESYQKAMKHLKHETDYFE